VGDAPQPQFRPIADSDSGLVAWTFLATDFRWQADEIF